MPDAWVDHAKTKIGYEIPLTRHFYRYVPPRPLEEIDAEIKALEEEIQALLGEVTGLTTPLSESTLSAGATRAGRRGAARENAAARRAWS